MSVKAVSNLNSNVGKISSHLKSIRAACHYFWYACKYFDNKHTIIIEGYVPCYFVVAFAVDIQRKGSVRDLTTWVNVLLCRWTGDFRAFPVQGISSCCCSSNRKIFHELVFGNMARVTFLDWIKSRDVLV